MTIDIENIIVSLYKIYHKYKDKSCIYLNLIKIAIV